MASRRADGIVSLHRPRRGYRVVGSFLRGRSRVPLDATLGAALHVIITVVEH